MWVSGGSSRDIGNTLGRSRSAIMGKINRLGLYRKDNPQIIVGKRKAMPIEAPAEEAQQTAAVAIIEAPAPVVAPEVPAPAVVPVAELPAIQPDVAVAEAVTVEVEPVVEAPTDTPAPSSARHARAAALSRATIKRETAPAVPVVTQITKPAAPRPSVVSAPAPAVTDAKQVVTKQIGKLATAKKPIGQVEIVRGEPIKPIVLEWLNENYPDEHDYHAEMLVIVTAALIQDITPVVLAQTAGVHLENAKDVRDSMLQAGLWRKDAGNVERYEGQEGWLQLVLEAMLARGQLRHVDGKWYLPKEAPKGKSW